jgi:hypothetical protein
VGHVEDRWYKTVKGEDDKPRREKTTLFGKGLRYRVRYLGTDGRERKKSFPDRAKKAADEFLVNIESDKLRGSYIDPVAGLVKFKDYAETWLRTRVLDESSSVPVLRHASGQLHQARPHP